jgi:hypothetical protein
MGGTPVFGIIQAQFHIGSVFPAGIRLDRDLVFFEKVQCVRVNGVQIPDDHMGQDSVFFQMSGAAVRSNNQIRGFQKTVDVPVPGSGPGRIQAAPGDDNAVHEGVHTMKYRV